MPVTAIALRLRLGVALACTGLALAFAVTAPPASGVVPPRKCGKIVAHGEAYSVRGHLVRCEFARRASKRFLRHGIKPRGWTCRKYPRDVTRIAFSCRRGGKDVYAIRR